MNNSKTCIYLILLLSGIFMVTQGFAISSNSNEENVNVSNKIAIAAVGDSITSKISERAGRAPYYLIFDGDGVYLKSIKNPSQKRGRGASSGVVNLLIKESVNTVIAGRFGDKMKRLLDTNKIEYHQKAGFANKVVETIIKTK